MFFLAAVCQQEFQPSLIFHNQSMPAEKFIGVPLFHPPMNSHLVLLLVQISPPPLLPQVAWMVKMKFD